MKTLAKLVLALVLTVLLSGVLVAQSVSDKEYNQFLIKSLQDENIGIRSSAAQLLGERQVTEAVKPLVKMLTTEENSSVRIVAALALYKIGDENALPALKKVAATDKNKTVRQVVAAIVQKLEKVELAQK